MNKEEREIIKSQVGHRYAMMSAYLTEQAKRIWAVSEATAIGHSGNSIVSEVTGISRVTINRGKNNYDDEFTLLSNSKMRQAGGGRKKISLKYPELTKELERLIDPSTRGDPESPLRWTCKSARNLAKVLQDNLNYDVSHRTVHNILEDLGYSLQSNRKKMEGKQHPDRDAQFRYINRLVKKFQRGLQPVISVDTKKKENIGNYANKGQEWEEKGNPTNVNTYDFSDKKNGKASPYGIFDLTNNEGWMNVGISKDTSVFAVESIRRWWKGMGVLKYPNANKLLITADGGASNGYRVRLWKREMQCLANEFGLDIHVCHFPPGTSKWNKIEHKMFSFVSKNWRGRPLDSLATIVNLIANTTTKEGLHIETSIDKNIYEKSIKVSDEEMKSLNIKPDKFQGQWNYKIIHQEQ